MCSVEFDRKDINMNKLVATSLEGRFHVFDMRTQHPTKGFASVSEKVSLRALAHDIGQVFKPTTILFTFTIVIVCI